MMKNLLFKSMLLLCALIVGGVHSAWAEEVTFAYGDYKGNGTTSSGSEYTMEKNDVSVSNNKFYGNNSYAHFYANGIITITPGAGVTISEIVLTASATGYNGYQSNGVLTPSTGSISGSASSTEWTWTGSATEAFTISNNKQIRWISIVVTYSKSGGGDTPTLADNDLALANAPIALSFDLYNNANVQVINYTTSSTGAVTVSQSEYVEATVDESNKTITVTPKKKTGEEQTVTVSQAADDNFKAGATTFTVTISDSTPKAESWVKTSLEDLTAGDEFVIVGNNGNTYAMSNDGGTSDAPSAVAVTIEDDEINGEVADNIKWNISVDDSGYTFYPNGSTETWLYCTNTNNGVRVGTNDAKHFNLSEEGYLMHEGTSRYVGIYQGQDWRCYTTINNNIKDQSFAFYKFVDNGTIKKTVVTIDDSGISNNDVYLSQEAGNLVAAVTCNNEVVEGATVTWAGDNDDVATIDAVGTVRLVGAGTVTFTASFAGNDKYKAGTATYEMTVINTNPLNPGTLNNPYTVAEARAAIDAGAGVTGVYATGIVSEIVTAYNAQFGNITYNISTDGKTDSEQLQAYRGKGIGGANFTSADDIQVGDSVVIYGNLTKHNTTYEFDQDNQLVSIERPAVIPAVAGVGCFVKVTSTEDITAGNYLIVYEGDDTHDAVAFDGSLETLDATGNGIAISILSDKIPATDATVASTFVLQRSGAVKSASGYFIGQTTNANGLTADNKKPFANNFAIDAAGNAVITAEGGCTLRYNYASDQLRFRYFKSGQRPVSLYKYDAAAKVEATITISAAGYATHCSTSDLDFSGVQGLKAYKATLSGTELTFSEVTTVPAGTGVLLKGAAGTYNVPVAAATEGAMNDNALIGVTKATKIEKSGIFVLMDGENGVGFYKTTKDAFTVGANTAYIDGSNLPTDVRFIGFDGETTGIATLEDEETSATIYNLNGQRVTTAKKGLYIVNGKKVVRK